MNKRCILAASLALFSGAGMAAGGMAQTGTQEDAGAEQAAGHEQGAWTFSRLDGDGDGSISRQEFEQALKQRWQRADSDGDGTINRAEFSALEQAGAGEVPGDVTVSDEPATGADTKMGEGDGVPPR